MNHAESDTCSVSLVPKIHAMELRHCNTLLLTFAVITAHLSARAQTTMPVDYSVLVTAEVQASPPRITLSWPPGRFVTSYSVARKVSGENRWETKASLAADASSFSDSDVAVGVPYEYQITKTTSRGFPGYGYIRAGIDLPTTESRGRILLVVDNTQAAALSFELTRLQQDLLGDGWTVLRQDVSPGDSVTAVRNMIKSHANLRAVFLLGHIPVPYSGDIMPDGHDNHRGAWPADVFYGDIDGNWTDNSVTSVNAERSINHNRPGDGKFDQSLPPTEVDLEIGRVDFWQMTTYANKTPSRSETDLLRQYLNKNHEFRHGRVNVNRSGAIADFFTDKGDDPVGNSGWRNFAPLLGSQNIRELGWEQYFPTTTQESFLMTYAAGGGSSYTLSAGIGTADDFSTRDVRVIFAMFLGSFYGDWNNESNFLRASLGSGSILAAAYAGFPHWLLHHMALGETIGFSARLTQNNRVNSFYPPYNQGAGEVHISLHGDPTLRLHPVVPPVDLSAQGGSGVRLSWRASSDNNLLGYHIFRAIDGQQNFVRVTSEPVSALEYTDPSPAGDYIYMVRALKREQTPSGSYLNLSQGIFARASSTGGSNPQPPAAPTALTATAVGPSAVDLRWTDNSSNENSFRIERRSQAETQFQEIANVAANGTTYNDSSVLPGTTYTYRVRARNGDGDSAYTAEVQVTTPQTAQPPATPTNLTAVAPSYNQVALSWTDASVNESSFRIERRAPSESQFQEISNTAADVTTYIDTSVLPSTTYRYRIRARNAVGDSPYTAEVQVTTGSAPQPTASVSFIGQETNIGGNWPQLFGKDGSAIPELATALPINVSLQLKSGASYLWEDTTADPRAVRKSASDSNGIASAWFDPQSVKIDFTTSDPLDVALYFLDWDRVGRVQDLSVLDTGTGVPLYQLRLDNFAEGKYVQLRLQGAVTIQLTKVSGPNAVLNALFVGGPSVGVPITAPTLSAQITASGMNIRLTVAAGSRLVLERTMNFESWDPVGEHQGTGSPIDIPLPTTLGTEFFRARMLEE